MYGWFLLGNNVAGIIFNMLVVTFFVVVIVAIGFLVYAAKKLKAAEQFAQTEQAPVAEDS
jgi:TM2 domain-containing membrane protein YozV